MRANKNPAEIVKACLSPVKGVKTGGSAILNKETRKSAEARKEAIAMLNKKNNSNTVNYAAIIDEARKMEFEYCGKNFLYFISNYCVIEDKDAEPTIQRFKPWEGQKKLIEDLRSNRLICILKARQLGITWLVIYWAIWAVVFHPGKTVIALSKTEDDSKEIIRRADLVLSNMRSLLKGGGVTYTKTALVITMNYEGQNVTGWIKSFTASESSGRSFTANMLILDEWAYQQFADEIWASTYPTVNRPGGGQVIGLSTIKRGTLFEKIVTEAPKNGFKLCFMPWWTDPRRTKEWYEKTIETIGLNRTRQEYPASIEEALINAEGAFFKEFRYEIHTCEPFTVSSGWRKYTTMDYGLDKLAHYTIYLDSQGYVYVTDEIYESNLTISDAAAKILEKAPGNERITRYAPPDLWNRQTAEGKSTAIMLYEKGIKLTKSNNDRASGWLAVKELLRIFKGIDGKDTARLKIFRNCVNLIRCITAIQTDEKNPCDVADKPHELTHAVDALRYFAISWAKPTKEKAAAAEENISNMLFKLINKKKVNLLGNGEKIQII